MALPPGPLRDAMVWTRTSDGVSLITMGLGLATASSLLGVAGLGGSLGSFIAIVSAIGYGFFLLAPAAKLDRHRLTVLASLALALLAIFVWLGLPYLLGAPDPWGGLTAFRQAEGIFILVTCVATALGLSALGLASFQLHDRTGRILLAAGVAVAIVTQVVLYFWLHAALDAVVVQPASVNFGYPWPYLFEHEWGRLGVVNAVPAGILTAALERLYWQRHRLAFPKGPPAHA